MKKILGIMLFISSLVVAQTVDTTSYASTDSIDLHAIVAKQIAAAIEKQLQTKINPKPVVHKTEAKAVSYQIEKNNNTNKADANPFFSFITSQPWQYQAFALISILIIGFVLIRRVVLSFTRTSTKKLKKKISLMREEKVGGSIGSPKLAKARKTLKENLELLKHSDRQISKKARQLNLSKGEILLAARLKLYEVGKM